MRFRVLVLVALTGLGVASCGENAPPAPESESSGALTGPGPALPAPPGGPVLPANRQVVSDPTATGTFSHIGSTGLVSATAHPPAAAPAGAPAVSAEPVPPRDAQWSMLCFSVTGPDHINLSKDIKEYFVRRSNRKDWYVIHGADASNIYFGFYRTLDDPKDSKEVARARSDLAMVKGLPDERGDHPFQNAAFIQLGAPDPSARPEWNLANVDRDKAPKDPSRAYWSLQIMAFKDNPKRKEAAVQAVEALRKDGYEAYYYHGETVSSVCIGAWPPSAVKQQDTSGGASDQVASPNDTIIVSPEPLPPSLIPVNHDSEGHPIKALAPRLEPADKTLALAIARWPDHLVNYELTVQYASRFLSTV